jgi:hypothetical protein
MFIDVEEEREGKRKAGYLIPGGPKGALHARILHPSRDPTRILSRPPRRPLNTLPLHPSPRPHPFQFTSPRRSRQRRRRPRSRTDDDPLGRNTPHARPVHHPSQASPCSTLTLFKSFFAKLTPPPRRLHCVHCHNFYHEIDDDDRSGLSVPHDDDSARGGEELEGGVGSYETLYGCCGRTVEGEGDNGPPDGWRYEGTHTVNIL